MSMKNNVQSDRNNPRYEAWAANMLRASQPKKWNEIVNSDYKNGYMVLVERVGCLHWVYYSIMHYLGKGTSLEYALCYYQKDEVVPSDWIDFDGNSNKEGFYKTEGLFCISAVILALVVLIKKLIKAGVYALGQTYDFRNGLYSMLSELSFKMSWIIVALILFQLFLALKSLAQGRRFGNYILNTVFIIFLPTGFGALACLYMAGSALLHRLSGVKSGVQYRKLRSEKKQPVSATVSHDTYSSVERDTYEKQRVREEKWQRAKEFEEYEKQRLEEKENRRKEDKRYRILKEIDDLKSKISTLEQKNRDLDAGLKAHQKGSWSYSVDPKLNRSTYESNLKEIGWLKDKIEKKENELRLI